MRGRATSTYRININDEICERNDQNSNTLLLTSFHQDAARFPQRKALPVQRQVWTSSSHWGWLCTTRGAQQGRLLPAAIVQMCKTVVLLQPQIFTDSWKSSDVDETEWDLQKSRSWICLPWCLAVKLLWDPKSLLLTGHFHCSEFKSIFGGECRLGRHPGSQDWAQTVLLGAGHVPNELWSWNNCFHGKRRFYIHLL